MNAAARYPVAVTARRKARPIQAALRAFSREPVLFFWCAFVASIPIYVGDSGTPQPGNALIFLILPLALVRWDGRLDGAAVRLLRALIVFTIWVCIVNYGWALITGKFNRSDYAVFPIYYIFNAAVMFAAILIYRRSGDLFLRATTYSVFFAVAYQVVVSFVASSDDVRSALFFNNPNQLGYWSLLAACTISLTQKRLKISMLIAGVGLSACVYLAVLSASRAAVAGVAILLVLLLFSNPKIIVAGMLAAVALSNVGGPLANAIESSRRRAELKDQDAAGGFVEERGYDRLWEHKEHLILGAGEGDFGRFNVGHEIHSSAATVLFSYGIVGAALFLAFVWRLISGASLRATLILVPTVAYTVAHQGLRFTMLWVLLSVFLAQKFLPRAPFARRA